MTVVEHAKSGNDGRIRMAFLWRKSGNICSLRVFSSVLVSASLFDVQREQDFCKARCAFTQKWSVHSGNHVLTQSVCFFLLHDRLLVMSLRRPAMLDEVSSIVSSGASLANSRDMHARIAVSNNHATLHFPKLLVHLLRLLAAAHGVEARSPAATNALLLARSVIMYATEHLDSADLAQLVRVPPGFLAEANYTSKTALAGAVRFPSLSHAPQHPHWQPLYLFHAQRFTVQSQALLAVYLF